MKISLWGCVLFIVVLLPQFVLSENIQFKQVTVSDGLSSNSVRAIYKDFKGFMWFGSLDGLDRFDGVEIRSFSEKLPEQHKRVNCVNNDNRGGLWVGTNGGLLYWDYISPEFRLIPVSSNDINVTTLISLPGDSLMLAASSQRLFLVNTKTFKHSRIALNSPDFDNIGGIIDGFHVDHNFVWLLASRGLLKLNLEDNSIQVFKTDTQDSAISNFSCFTSFNGNILVGTFLEGIFLFDIEAKRFYPFEEVENRFILSLKFQSDNDILHVGTDGDGFVILNKKNGALKTIAKDYSNPYSLNSNAIYSIYIDDNDRYWLGTYSGGVNYNVGKGNFFDVSIEKDGMFLGDKSIRSIFFDENGNEFIGTRDGFFVFRKDDSSQFFNTENNDFLNSDVILTLNLHKGNLLLGTFRGGISLYNMQTGKLESFREDANFKSDSFYAIEQDQDGNLWLGGISGMYRIDVQTDNIKHYTRDNSELKRNGTICIFFDSQNRMWVGTVVGTSVYSIDNGNLKDLESDFDLVDYKSVSFFEDHLGSIWLATEGAGLCRVSSDLSSIQCYTTGDGLSSNFITAITEAPDDVFWISTSRGMSRFDKASESFSNYTLADGLPSLVFNRGAVINQYDAKGKIWFGSENGLLSFYPDSLSMRNAHTKVVLTDFYLAGQIVDPEIGTFLDRSIDQMTDIHLPGGDNSFGFRFVALNYQNPVDNKYYYRVLGKDENWQLADGNQVSFSDIKPGKYTFEICLSDRIPSVEDVITSVNVFVKPRFYQQPLFLVFVIVFLSGIFLFGWFVLSRLKKELASLRKGVNEKSLKPRYESSILSSKRRTEIEEALVRYINESKAYKNSDLNLSDLAHSIDCSSHHISQVINQNLKQSYSDFINSHRVEAVKLLIKDPSFDKYTLFAIAQECGFKSKTSFYRAFKKITGQTPVEYQAMIKKKF